MQIGLIDVDGHNFPNLALMKISAYHKALGHYVEWINYFNDYDIVYKSKVFTFSKDDNHKINSKQIIYGGTGYSVKSQLPKEIDTMYPDYSIYPKYKRAYGFLTRGCIRNCSWCIVPAKEGVIKPYWDIERILQGRKEAVLMDNNVLAHPFGLRQIEKIIKLKCRVDFNQGLDSRLVTDEIAQMLTKVKWIRYMRFACDHISQVDPLVKTLEMLNKYGFKNRNVFVYTLIKDIEESEKRVSILKKLGVNPFAQPFRDFNNNTESTHEQKRFARYVNHKAIFKKIDSYKDYKDNVNDKIISDLQTIINFDQCEPQ